jgi:hypothetical protein
MVILFLMVLMIIGMIATAPAIKTEIQRDREQEMIHRGAQYSRAIKRYFKKFGRYPGTIDQLKNTNNIRFLRREYKDPMTADGKWRLLHLGDVKLGTSSNIGTPVSAMGTQGGTSGNLGQQAGQSAFGQGGSGSSFGGATGAFGGATGTLGGSGNTIGGLGAMGGSSPSATNATGAQASPSGAVGSQASTTGSSSMTSSTNAIGGGVIIGVASLSEKEGLHEFNEKTHYNEWFFFYDPTTDRGGLITGPYTGKTFAAAGGIGTPASALGQQQQQPSAFGQPSSFGQSGGTGQPAPPPQQQQQNPR